MFGCPATFSSSSSSSLRFKLSTATLRSEQLQLAETEIWVFLLAPDACPVPRKGRLLEEKSRGQFDGPDFFGGFLFRVALRAENFHVFRFASRVFLRTRAEFGVCFLCAYSCRFSVAGAGTSNCAKSHVPHCTRMTKDWALGEVLKAVFPLLDGDDLASCMLVCRLWRDVARDDYFWKCACAKKWPSIYKRQLAPALNHHKLFLTFTKHHRPQPLLPPKLSFEDLEFYIDLWSEEQLVFSAAASGLVLQSGINNPPSGICEVMRIHLDGPNFKMMMPVEPRLTIPRGRTVDASVLVGRCDNNKMACIVNHSVFDYVDGSAFRALAYDYLNFSPSHPFVSGVRAWLSLLFMAGGSDEAIDVFGIEIDFCDAASSETEVLWLLDMLDWK
ncbi:hypothetical protein Taro_021045 [Colocasia esculenta]|uniref:F-box domain-containing protein n=1 Tax=Colocasia esculenta TaxID=4460 RepID=A0A843VAA8_COLES|nr:hypothetical protein [Colocasia esculenta]